MHYHYPFWNYSHGNISLCFSRCFNMFYDILTTFYEVIKNKISYKNIYFGCLFFIIAIYWCSSFITISWQINVWISYCFYNFIKCNYWIINQLLCISRIKAKCTCWYSYQNMLRIHDLFLNSYTHMDIFHFWFELHFLPSYLHL